MSEIHTERGRLQRERILDATLRLIAAGGFEAFTLRELEAELGVARGAVKYYFPSKEALLEAALERIITRNRQLVDEHVFEETGIAALRVFLIEVLPVSTINRRTAPIIVSSWARSIQSSIYRTLLSENTRRWRLLLRGAAEQARRDGELNDSAPDSRHIADLLATLVAGTMPMAFLLTDEATPERMLAMGDAFLDAIASETGRAVLAQARGQGDVHAGDHDASGT